MARWIVAGVITVFAVIGVLVTVDKLLDKLAAGSAQAWGWWRDRERPVDPPWWWKPWLSNRVEDDDYQLGYNEDTGQYEELPPPLPPERTWEQMTSHQLPLEERLVGELERQGWFDAGVQARLRAEHEARRMSPAERKDWQRLERNRKRRARRVEMTYRAHYAAMGYEYPSGLMARVRELTP